MKDSKFASSSAVNSISNEQQEQEEEVGQEYQPQSPYYSPEQLLEFYEDE